MNEHTRDRPSSSIPVAGWLMLFMIAPVLASAVVAAVGYVTGVRAIQEMAGIGFFAFVTVPLGLALIVLYELMKHFSSSAERAQADETEDPETELEKRHD